MVVNVLCFDRGDLFTDIREKTQQLMTMLRFTPQSRYIGNSKPIHNKSKNHIFICIHYFLHVDNTNTMRIQTTAKHTNMYMNVCMYVLIGYTIGRVLNKLDLPIEALVKLRREKAHLRL